MAEEQTDRSFWLEEEMLLVRHSGEIPEVALHGSLYFLTRDPEGPQLKLQTGEVARLEEQAARRYAEIILRDLQPANRDLSIYRGVARSLANWRRYKVFCARNGSSCLETVRHRAAAALVAFFRQEAADVQAGQRKSCVNCSAAELLFFVQELKIDEEELPAGWEKLCPIEE